MPKTAHGLSPADLDELHDARETLDKYAWVIGEALECGYSAESLTEVASAMEMLINEPLT